MSKREFIDKNEIPFSCRHDCWTGNCIKCDEKTVAQYEINKMSAITEKEIVKPYLEKLKEEVQKEENILYHDCEADFSKSYDVIRTDTVIELIDNLLTEKGTEE